MNQILNQDPVHSDDFYKQEIEKLLEEMQHNNQLMARDQEEIKWLKQQSAVTIQRIDENLQRLEKLLA